MHENEDDTANSLVKNERRGVWLALVVIMILATTLVVDSDTRRALLTGLAVALVFAVTWLGQKAVRKSPDNSGESRKAVMQDEWRLAALARSYKWAFVAVLAALSAFCITSAITSIDISASMLAALIVALAVTVFLGFFLLFDRV
jgi:O-antigen ligase